MAVSVAVRCFASQQRHWAAVFQRIPSSPVPVLAPQRWAACCSTQGGSDAALSPSDPPPPPQAPRQAKRPRRPLPPPFELTVAALDMPLRGGVAAVPASVQSRGQRVLVPFAPLGATVRAVPRAVVEGVLIAAPVALPTASAAAAPAAAAAAPAAAPAPAPATHTHTDGAWATPSTIVEPGPHAVAPRCPYYGGACGGCAFQSTAVEAQGLEKAAYVTRCLTEALPASHHASLAAATLPLWAAVPPYGYRNRAEMTVAGDAGELGFFPYRPPPMRWRPEVTPVQACDLLPPRVSAAFRAVRSALASLGGAATTAHVVTVSVRAGSVGGGECAPLLIILRTHTPDAAFEVLGGEAFTAALRAALAAEFGGEVGAVSLVLSHHPTSIPRATVRTLRDACATAAPTAPARADALLAAKAAYLAGVQRIVWGAGELLTTSPLSLASALPPPLATLWTRLAGAPHAARRVLRDAVLTVRVSPLAFSQPSDAGAAAISSAVATAVAGVAPADGAGVVWDLFCGGGALGLAALLTGAARRVVGIDINPAAVADAAANAARNGVAPGDAAYVCADLAGARVEPTRDGVTVGGTRLPPPDVVVVDPPRPGIGPRVATALRALAPPAVVYVSCNPASLATDAAALCAEGAYHIAALLPLDQFPHTPHVETVAVLRKGPPPPPPPPPHGA